MPEKIYGFDNSAWQGEAGKDYDIQVAWDSGMRFAWLKAGQDDWVDRVFLHNYEVFRSSPNPWILGAYWFTTTFNALAQANAFLNVTKNLKLDLPLCQDVEFYSQSAYSQNVQTYERFPNAEYVDEREAFPVLDFRYAQTPTLMQRYKAKYQYSITTEAIVDVIARKLAGQQGWEESAIYTNKYSGDTVFKTARFNWQRLHLFDAYWSTTADKPLLPKMWESKGKYIAWQYGVDAGLPHGFPGSLDHDVWGNDVDFPGTGDPYKTITFDPVVIRAGEVELGLFEGRYERK